MRIKLCSGELHTCILTESLDSLTSNPFTRIFNLDCYLLIGPLGRHVIKMIFIVLCVRTFYKAHPQYRHSTSSLIAVVDVYKISLVEQYD